jgi:hypothetical protein
MNGQEIKISVVTPLGMLHEIPVQFYPIPQNFYISDVIVVDIIDRCVQSITSFPINEQFIQLNNQENLFLVNGQEIKISVVTPLGMLHEIPVQFTDALYGASIPNTAEFGKGQVFQEIVNIFNKAGIKNYINVDMLVYTGPNMD